MLKTIPTQGPWRLKINFLQGYSFFFFFFFTNVHMREFAFSLSEEWHEGMTFQNLQNFLTYWFGFKIRISYLQYLSSKCPCIDIISLFFQLRNTFSTSCLPHHKHRYCFIISKAKVQSASTLDKHHPDLL